ncbi:ubiquitin-like protein Pup [Salsipaludibacter albus]|uniref:ubiquitin-like protein Pup n=1 Tax=Salsipaludibacter albus TaxID=2849650 RepID=UPI001EE4889A|nr:ubiquitin-like protein Pup [Salsipaludibacter albus]MBY5161659.1 ubiquitin-like protein Pup [Salsipaludibacter albus]
MADNQGASSRRRSTEQPVEEAEADATTSSDSATDLSDVDALLDEIDEVLEENAEDFVRNYVQKGGQ